MPSVRAIATVSRHRADEEIGAGIHPVAAETVLAEEFAAVGDAADVLASEVLAGEVEEAVVERAVGGEDHARTDVVEDGAEAFRAQEAMTRVVQPGDLQEVEVNVVRPGSVALDAVIEADAEAVERVGVLQALVNLNLVGGDGTGTFARPVDERTGAHVVPAAGAGCQNERAQRRKDEG